MAHPHPNWPGDTFRLILKLIVPTLANLWTGQAADLVPKNTVKSRLTVAAFCSARTRLALARVTGRRAALARRLRCCGREAAVPDPKVTLGTGPPGLAWRRADESRRGRTSTPRDSYLWKGK